MAENKSLLTPLSTPAFCHKEKREKKSTKKCTHSDSSTIIYSGEKREKREKTRPESRDI